MQMEHVKYALTSDENAPAIISVNGFSTPVWRQNRWTEGKYAVYIQKNGCGHCCTAMAARLHGVAINPHTEYEQCRRLFGEPRQDGNPAQDHFMSVSGIVKVLTGFQIQADYFGVPENGADNAVRHILASLSEGKQVIFWSHPSENFPQNPFSQNEHYVLAAGFSEKGKIVIANSSEKAAPEGVQLVDSNAVAAALAPGSEPADITWGEPEHLHNCSGYVVVGEKIR
jgi:hypothetical protein